MKIEILGSGGATVTPRPFCNCEVCQQAYQQGIPYSRMGPAYFIHDANLLIDTPEEISPMLVRSQIERVEAATYSHWHPDHTSGIRVFEANLPVWKWPPRPYCTPIYLPPKVADDFKEWLDLEERATYLQGRGVLRLTHLAEEETFSIKDITIRPILLDVGYVYAFLLSDDRANVLIAPDELFQWQPPDDLPPLDLLIVPMGLFEFHPFTGERTIPADHPVLESEATFRQTLEIIRKINTRQTILAHIEEVNSLGYDDYVKLSEKLAHEQPDLGPVSFAYDQQKVEI